MARGKTVEEGARRQAPNGYWYVKIDGRQRLLHHVLLEKHRGKPIDTETERVIFLDGDRSNLDIMNIAVRPKGKASLRRRRAAIEHRIEELKAELEYIDKELNG